MDVDDDLDFLASLLEENEVAAKEDPEENVLGEAEAGDTDEYNELFDADTSSSEELDAGEGESGACPENMAGLFGDVSDLSEEEKETVQNIPQSLPKEKTSEELQDELRQLQEQMKKLQEQLQITVISQPANSPPGKKTSEKQTQGPKPMSSSLPQPLKSVARRKSSVGSSQRSQALQSSSVIKPEVSVETFSGLRLRTAAETFPKKSFEIMASECRDISFEFVVSNTCQLMRSQRHSLSPDEIQQFKKPRVSSADMERKMAGRTFIRLSQLQDKLSSGNLEETDWVTFGVIIKKFTPQSSTNGKTFSIWCLNDLRDFSRCVSLFLFGEVHKDHWKADRGMVIGLLNATPMKPKERSNEVCVSVDHPQKILLLGEAMDLGTCKAKKKNGERCTQIVNLNSCEYCQYHVQSQYRQLSSKRADLQSTFSVTRAPKRNTKKALGLKERLCQDGFYYGGVSSAAYAASAAAAAAPKKKIQTTLSNLVVKGVDTVLQETKQKLGLPNGPLQCSEEFRELLATSSFGARNLNQHLTKASTPAAALTRRPSPGVQPISASALLKQQKQQVLEARKRRSEELQRKFLQSVPTLPSSLGPPVLLSPTPGAEFPKVAKLSNPQTPRLGRGFSEGDDILFFDNLAPPALQPNDLAEAKKRVAVYKLRAKGQILSKIDPNSIKRKRSDVDILELAERIQKNIPALEGNDTDGTEPVQKKHCEQLAYLECEEFQEILHARSKHTGVLKKFEAEVQERYFDPLVKKEQMEEKMKSIREVKCRVVTCKTCKYTYFKLLDSCVEQRHDYNWHDGVKRFFKCPCGNRAISLDKLPKKHCSHCGLFKWERDGMLKEKKGPKIGAETLLPRGEEHHKFLNSLK